MVKLSPWLFFAPHLGHFAGGLATIFYFHYLNPSTYSGPDAGGAITPTFLVLILIAAATMHTSSAVLHTRRLRRTREIRTKDPAAWSTADRDALAAALFAIPGALLLDTLLLWLVMAGFVTVYAVVVMQTDHAGQIFFGTALVGGSIANLTGYLIADTMVRREMIRVVGALDVLVHHARWKLPQLMLAFLLVVGLLPVTIVAWLSYGYGRLLAVDPAAEEVATRLTRGSILIWFITVAVTVVSMVWIRKGLIQPLARLSGEMGRVARGDFHIRLPVASDDDIGQISSSFNRMAMELSHRERLREMFGRYVSESVLEQLLDGTLQLRLGGERREVAILFADIRGFTGLAETLPPERTTEVVNAYLEAMTTPIHNEGGTIVEYLGDATFAVFGAPIPFDDAAARAVRASLAIRDALEALRARHRESGLPAPDVGIGIHYGPAVVGNIGSATRMKYGVIGDAVNVAARIQGLTREYNATILVSEDVQSRLGGDMPSTCLGDVRVKGRADAVRLYRIA